MLSLSLHVSKSVLFQSFFSQFSHYNANKITHSLSLTHLSFSLIFSFSLSFPLSQSFFLSHLPIKCMPSKRVYHICINILNRTAICFSSLHFSFSLFLLLLFLFLLFLLLSIFPFLFSSSSSLPLSFL